MKASPGLNYVTGPMGAGKSYFGVRQIVRAIMRGKYVITNVLLREDWARLVAKHASPLSYRLNFIPLDFLGAKYRRRKIFYESLYIYETELERAMKYRVPGKKEGRAVFVWDEAHNDLNNREWNSTKVVKGKGAKKVERTNLVTGETTEGDVTEKDVRSLILKWATQLRKLGFVGYLISQHGDNTDAALRRICNMEVRLRNQREQVRFLGLRICPIPFFLAMYLPANTPRIGRGSPYISIDRYFLGWEKKCYDSMGLFHNIQEHIEGEDAVWLPTPGGFTADVRAGLAVAPDVVAPAAVTAATADESPLAGLPVAAAGPASGPKISPKRGTQKPRNVVSLVRPKPQTEGGQ
jgi:hypothetical protein